LLLPAQASCIALLLSVCAVPSFANEQSNGSSCPRSEPTAVFTTKSPTVATQSFRLVDGAGIEEIHLKSGQTIRVKNWGCEYYVVTFLVEPAEHSPNLSVRSAYEQAASWLIRLKELSASPPFKLDLAARTLRNHYRNERKLAFDSEIPVEGDGTDFLQTRVKVEKPEEGRKAGALQFSLFTGPL
jgi:hypothetical protein